MKQTLKYFIRGYLENRPLFFSFIRPQEAYLFYKHLNLLHSPILDFGCGDGFFAELVFGEKKIDVGLDLKNSRAPEAEAKGIYKKIAYYDGIVIPYKENYFNSIVSNCVLEHLPYLQKNIQEIYRVLKPGGYFITTVMADKWEQTQLGAKLLGNTYRNYMRRKQEHSNLLSVKQWNSSFKKAGFSVEECVGYLSPTASNMLDAAHYVSIPSLVSHKLTGKWVPFPKLNDLLKLENHIEKIISKTVIPAESSALFYILKK